MATMKLALHVLHREWSWRRFQFQHPYLRSVLRVFTRTRRYGVRQTEWGRALKFLMTESSGYR